MCNMIDLTNKNYFLKVCVMVWITYHFSINICLFYEARFWSENFPSKSIGRLPPFSGSICFIKLFTSLPIVAPISSFFKENFDSTLKKR